MNGFCFWWWAVAIRYGCTKRVGKHPLLLQDLESHEQVMAFASNSDLFRAKRSMHFASKMVTYHWGRSSSTLCIMKISIAPWCIHRDQPQHPTYNPWNAEETHAAVASRLVAWVSSHAWFFPWIVLTMHRVSQTTTTVEKTTKEDGTKCINQFEVCVCMYMWNEATMLRQISIPNV
jgi:hypothetical protein